MTIQARFYVAEFNEKAVAYDATAGVPVTVAEVVMNPVTRKTDVDNVDWSKYSPSGKFTITVTQREGGAFEAFRALLGKDVRILIDPAD